VKDFTGTSRLIRLALRRDRVKLPLWIFTLGSLMILLPVSVSEVYSTKEEQMAYAMSSAVSAVARGFNGPITGADIGSITLAETFTFMTIFVSLMSTLLIIRHTRQNEETGRAEMLHAAAVGRYALLTAALIIAVGANVLVGTFAAAGYIMAGLQIEGSLLAGVAMGMVGVIFAGLAGIFAQVTQTARAANGLAATSIGVAFLIRALGDMQGKVQPSGVEVVSAWPTWLSPIGWARESHPFTENYWWMLGLMVVFFVVLVYFAFRLRAHRDLGAGLLPAKNGRPRASPLLNSPLGLAWRLQRGTLFGWMVGLGVMGISLGAVAHEVGTITSSSPEVTAIVTAMGGSENLIDSYMAFSMSLLGMAVAGYVIQALLRLRSEEVTGYLEPLLATATHRSAWMWAYIWWAVFGAILLLLTIGITVGIAYGVSTDDILGKTAIMIGAALVQLPPALLFGGIVVALFGILPRFVMTASWGVFTLLMGVSLFGALLKLPDWTQDVSPFSHVPTLPLESINWTPLLAISVIAVLLAVFGFVGFRRRDITLG
jgi:ABC-2 type transport system permease protein